MKIIHDENETIGKIIKSVRLDADAMVIIFSDDSCIFFEVGKLCDIDLSSPRTLGLGESTASLKGLGFNPEEIKKLLEADAWKVF